MKAGCLLENMKLQIFVLLVLFIAAYYVPLNSMANIWLKNEDYSYGFLIPIASAYLLWEKRKTFSQIPIATNWHLLPVLVLFLLLSLYGILGSSGNVSMPSIPVLIILFASFCYGLEVVKRLIVPFGFLFFMVPVPGIIERNIGLFLKSVSSKLGAAFIGLFNIPVHLSGNVIDLGVSQLQVVDACSGLRYVFPLLAIGVLYAYLFEKVLWKKFVLVLLTVPLAVLMNALRIGITGVLTDRHGVRVAEGFFHGFSGWILFVVAFLLLFLLGRFLTLIPKGKCVTEKTADSQKHSNARVMQGKTAGAFLCSVALLSCVAVFSLSTEILPPMKIDGGIESFPPVIGDWKGRPEPVDPEIVRQSGAEEAFSGIYVNGEDRTVSLYMGYRSTAFLATENFFHSPTVCLPSSGWVEREVGRRTVAKVPHFGSLEVTKMLIEKEGSRQLVYFWFQTKDRATYDKNINRFHLSLHALRRDNTHDLFIRPITPLSPTETIGNAEKRLDGFVREMMPVLLQFLKENQVTG